MDFFSNISSDLQTPWKEMLLHRADNFYSNDFSLQYPEIEAQLKLLYTAVTRCIERLFFVETTTSKAGDAFIRWSTTTSITPFDPNVDKIDKALATLSDCTNVESMGMNRDEWLAAGLSNAEAADAEEYDFENKCSLLKKAVYCFEQGRHDVFVRKAKAQLKSVEFRMKLPDIELEDVDLLRRIEKEAVCIIHELFGADMGSEVLESYESLVDIMSKLYSSSDFLQRYLIINAQSICAKQRKAGRELCDQTEPHSKPSAEGSRRESLSEYTSDKSMISKTSETSRDEVEGNVFEKTEQLTNSPCSVTQSLFSSGSRRELLSECTPDESMRAISQVAKTVKEVKATNRRVRATNWRVRATNRRVIATNRRVRATNRRVRATKATESPETSRYEVGGNEFEKAKPLDNCPCSVTQSLFASDEFLSDLEKSFRDAGTNHTFTSSNLQEELMHVNGTPRTKTRYKISYDFDNSPMILLMAHFLIKNKM